MPTILKIGYQEYLVKNDAAAFNALKALCGAVRLESRHVGSGRTYRELFWPSDRDSEVSIKTVLPDQIVRCDPGEIVEFEPQKQLGFGKVK